MFQKIKSIIQYFAFDHASLKWTVPILFVFEIALGLLMIRKVAYTEIDWIAYMQEVEGFMNGERDYLNLRGDTGPLVYPAGFVYCFSFLRWITNEGKNILLAQHIFLGIYLLNQVIVWLIYIKTKSTPPWVLILLCLSKRIHSIFMLRCFNDCIAMLLVYISIYFLLNRRHIISSIFFSLAISIKMNILLFFPGFLLLLVKAEGAWFTLFLIILIIIIQIILAIPFLITFPKSYLIKAFEFSRVFSFEWTVNFRFLGEEIFISKQLANILLISHLLILLLFAFKWCSYEGGLFKFITSVWGNRKKKEEKQINNNYFGFGQNGELFTAQHATLVLFTSNFIGIVFARTLHYQFYVWYFHTLPFLLFNVNLHLILKLVILFAIEWAFNVFPSTFISSLILQICHYILLISLIFTPLKNAYRQFDQEKKKKKEN